MSKIDGLKSYINNRKKQLNYLSQLDSSNNGPELLYDAILIAGLIDGFKPTAEQVEIFKLGFGNKKNVKPFDFYFSDSNMKKIKDFINLYTVTKIPPPPIFLFSAGCRHAGYLADIIGIDKNKIYIIEPSLTGGDTEKNIRYAINKKPIGVPAKNIYTNEYYGGRIEGTQDSGGAAKTKADKISYTYNGVTKYEWDGHWDALRAVGELKQGV